MPTNVATWQGFPLTEGARDTLPGPLLGHTTDVIDALTDLDRVAAEHAGRYAAFREKFASLEDGRAAARFVDQLLTNGS